MKAVILVAGKGTRLSPLTDYTPKPMLSVAGRPLLEWMIMRVKEAGITEILLVTNYLEEQFKTYFGDGSKHGVKISYKKQEKTLGTANAFLQAEEFVGENQFMALYGDHYIANGVLKKIKNNHQEGEVAVGSLLVEDPSQYGAFKLDGEYIKKVVEKPPKGKEPSKYANIGIYIFPHGVFDYIKKTPLSPREEYEITDTMQLMIDDNILLRKHEIATMDWLDIGLPWNLLEANQRALQNIDFKIDGTVEDGAKLHGQVWVKNGARIRSGAYIEGPVVIGENSDIGPNCYIRSGTYLGNNVRIGNACEIKNSIIGDGSHAAHLSYVGDSVMGKNCNLGAGTITANLRFDKTPIEVTIKGERLNSGRKKLGVIMGDNVQIGINVSIHPGAIIGSDAWIAPGVTVQRDVPNGVIKYFFSKLEERKR
jgi:UDP-N-acetylglucosamine diphosphorylase / glucose-1-phosphate thymidylyltransferase / UDP-N-acetylgalactosamine diphosphorylase / glucosamine-1-phosphate N-acetyltransferase / galactosamine-1-phosphate N-acetyltransferase